MNLREFANRANGFDFDKEANQIFDDNAELIVQLNREQLMEGKSSTGEDIRPYYSEDDYFKKPGAAERYAIWKQRITPNSKRGLDVPNLFIVGRYHYSFFYRRTGNEFWTATNDSLGFKIEKKFKHTHTLTPENCLWFGEEKVLPEIMQVYKQKLTG